MTSLITGTWTLISSSAEIITGARRMTLRIHRLLQPGVVELSEGDRRRLLGLQKRVECLVQPLNFLLLWSKQRDSCVQQVVLSAQELLFDVCSFVERFVPPDGTPTAEAIGRPPGPGGGIDSEKLQWYLRELEFTCASVGMAVSIARATESTPLPRPAVQELGSGGSGCWASSGVSLSALLRASRRIQEMHGRSGDLCTCPGRLYVQALPSVGPSGAAAGSSANGCFQPPPRAVCNDSNPEGRRGPCEWQPVLSLAAFKVVAAVDGKLRRRRYRISVESRLPLSQPGHHEDYLYEGSREDELGTHGCCLNASGPLDFPIEAALEGGLVTTGRLSLPLALEPARCSLDLAVDSLALLWGSCQTTAACEASCQSAGEDPAGELADTVLVPEGLAAEAMLAVPRPLPAVPRPLWPASRRLRSPALQQAGSASNSRYAFVFDGRRGEAELRMGEAEAEVALTPLDAMYLARLCAYDDVHQQPFLVQDCSSGSEATSSGCPPHLLSSDEVLAALLTQRDAEWASTSAAALGFKCGVAGATASA